MPTRVGFPVCTAPATRNSRNSTLANIVTGAFTPVLAKHTKNLGLFDVFPIEVDWIQRNFEPVKKQVEAWKAKWIPDEAAKLVIYRAFVQGELDVRKHSARRVHQM